MNHKVFLDQIMEFPAKVASVLQQLIPQQGSLSAEQVDELKALTGLSMEDLLKTLLPLAATMSTCPISNFMVGAIVEGYRAGAQGPIYFGANLEITKQPLKVTIHAEQAAVCNAWHNGETQLRRLMVNEAPCGHCRQFLNELNEIDQMDIVISQLSSNEHHSYQMAELLPNAFGPANLGQTTCLMSPLNQSMVSPDESDPLVNAATEAANRSYAPYSGCYCGIALRMKNGSIVVGRYAENVAFNPGLTALESALINLRLSSLCEPHGQVIDAVMIEKEAAISHQSLTAAITLQMGAKLRSFVV